MPEEPKTLTPEEALRRIERWQMAGFVHPLTCGGLNDTCRADLKGELREGKVVLVCSSCGHVQTHVPEHVLSDATDSAFRLMEALRQKA